MPQKGLVLSFSLDSGCHSESGAASGKTLITYCQSTMSSNWIFHFIQHDKEPFSDKKLLGQLLPMRCRRFCESLPTEQYLPPHLSPKSAVSKLFK
jgi:hypothetical protein